jgi:hypothetical protein
MTHLRKVTFLMLRSILLNQLVMHSRFFKSYPPASHHTSALFRISISTIAGASFLPRLVYSHSSSGQRRSTA